MDMETAYSAQPHGKIHTWILIMSVWTLVMSIVIIGLMMTNSGTKSEVASEVSAACENGVTNAIHSAQAALAAQANTTDEAITCASPTNPTYQGQNSDGLLPSVRYPYGWSAEHRIDTTQTFIAQPGVLFSCSECGGMDRQTRLFITGRPASEAEEMDVAKLQAWYTEQSKSEDTEYTNLVINSKTLSNGTAVYIDGHAKIDAAGEGEYDFHEVRFLTKNSYVKVQFVDMDGSAASEWTDVKASLDFSKIK